MHVIRISKWSFLIWIFNTDNVFVFIYSLFFYKFIAVLTKNVVTIVSEVVVQRSVTRMETDD